MRTPPTEHDDLDTITSVVLLIMVGIAALLVLAIYYGVRFLMLGLPTQ
jgi:hypothetical protein